MTLAEGPDLSGTVVLVTGAARGLGRSISTILAAHGASLAITATSGDLLDELAAECDGRAIPIVADLAEPAGTARIAEVALAHYGRVDALVNNAGMGMTRYWPDWLTERVPFWEIEDERFQEYLRVNFLAGLDLARRLVPGMIDRGWGRIINVTTSLDSMLKPGMAPYGVSKAAGETMTAIQAGELAGTGVTANAVTTGGGTNTRMISRSVPTQALFPPTIIDLPVLWLLSREADGVTGRRFVGAQWRTDLPLPAAAALCAAPVAWTGYGQQATTAPPSTPGTR
jgi:3-oxoacyl-[acyl-carrier protein] reductase